MGCQKFREKSEKWQSYQFLRTWIKVKCVWLKHFIKTIHFSQINKTITRIRIENPTQWSHSSWITEAESSPNHFAKCNNGKENLNNYVDPPTTIASLIRANKVHVNGFINTEQILQNKGLKEAELLAKKLLKTVQSTWCAPSNHSYHQLGKSTISDRRRKNSENANKRQK